MINFKCIFQNKAEKEASDLIDDIVKALARKELSAKIFLKTIESFQEITHSISIGIGQCKECRISYSKGKVEGFCEKHETLRKEFQKMIDKTLRD